MSGVDVLTALKRNPNMRHVLLVMHTATWGPSGSHPQAPEADLFLSKPIDNEKLAMLRAEFRLRKKMRRQ